MPIGRDINITEQEQTNSMGQFLPQLLRTHFGHTPSTLLYMIYYLLLRQKFKLFDDPTELSILKSVKDLCSESRGGVASGPDSDYLVRTLTGWL